MSETKDKTRIWNDCATCAYKHLTAAYAAMTAEPSEVSASVDGDTLMNARAAIALREYESGYAGNLHLAAGCLGMAELLAGEDADSFREARLALPRQTFGVPRFGAHAWAGANFVEALREFPELSSRVQAHKWVAADGFYVDSVPEFLEMLIDQIDWLSKTYEIGVTTHG